MMGMVVGAATKLLPDVIKRILPREKMSEEDQKKLEQEFEKELLSLDWKMLEKEVEDRVSARHLAEEELKRGNAWTNALAAIHRPIWSLVTLAVFVWTMVSQQFNLPSIEFNDLHAQIMQTVIIFYFGGRSVEKGISIAKGKSKI